MKTTSCIWIACLAMLLAASASAQIGNLRSVGRKVLDERKGDAKSAAGEVVSEEVAGESDSADPVGISLDNESFNIAFSSNPIDPSQPGESKKEFVAGENIYALALLPKTLRQYYPNAGPNAPLDVEIFLYSVKISPYEWITEPVEEQLTFVNMKASGSVVDQTYLRIDLVPDPAQTNAYGTDEISYKKFGSKFDGPVAFAETLAEKLEPGDNIVKVVVKCYYEEVAAGMISISGDDFSVFNEMAEQLNHVAQNAGIESARMPTAERTDPAMEKQMIETVKSSNAWANKRLDATEILRVNIYNADWHIRRHEISGAILHRYIRAAMAVKTQSGECAYYIITFQEDYVGGKFQPMKYDGAGDKVMLLCEHVHL